MTDKQEQNMKKAIRFWDRFPVRKVDQGIGGIPKKRWRKHVRGCFGAHMAELFQCQSPHWETQNYWVSSAFRDRMEEILGITKADFQRQGVYDPFWGWPWHQEHRMRWPADVLRAIFQQKMRQKHGVV